jgi:hypothetical protein
MEFSKIRAGCLYKARTEFEQPRLAARMEMPMFVNQLPAIRTRFDATIELDLSMSIMNVGVLQLSTSNRMSRIASMYYNNASGRPKPIEDIQDNGPSELVTCSTSASVHLSAIHQTTSSDHPIARVHWRHAKVVRPAYLPCRLRLTRRGNRQRYLGVGLWCAKVR